MMKNFLFICLLSVALGGCSMIERTIKNGKLEIATTMSNSIMLDPVSQDKKRVILKVSNTSGVQNLSTEYAIASALAAKGYTIVTNPKDAHFMINVNILSCNKDNAAVAGANTSSSGIVGGVAGAAAAGKMSDSPLPIANMMLGAVAGSVAESMLDSSVQVVEYKMITNIVIGEKSNKKIRQVSTLSTKQGSSGSTAATWQEDSEWKKYTTSITSTARKTNLKMTDDITRALDKGLVDAIANIF